MLFSFFNNIDVSIKIKTNIFSILLSDTIILNLNPANNFTKVLVLFGDFLEKMSKLQLGESYGDKLRAKTLQKLLNTVTLNVKGMKINEELFSEWFSVNIFLI